MILLYSFKIVGRTAFPQFLIIQNPTTPCYFRLPFFLQLYDDITTVIFIEAIKTLLNMIESLSQKVAIKTQRMIAKMPSQ
mgnify:CR=1 FL=1